MPAANSRPILDGAAAVCLDAEPIESFVEPLADVGQRFAAQSAMTLRAVASLPAALPGFDRHEGPYPRQAGIPGRGVGTGPLEVQVVGSVRALGAHLAALQDLADDALEANVFYEPWLLKPAWENLQRGAPLRMVLIYEIAPGTQGQRLCGFFPLEPDPRFEGLPLRAWRLWKHVHCFLCTPLVRARRARETLETLFNWACRQTDVDVLDFSHVRGDGPFHDLLLRQIDAAGTLSCMSQRFARALWTAGRGLDEHLQQALSAGARKEYRRQRKRLAELGRLEFRMLRDSRDLDGWLQDFLRLEASGWKAREGHALDMDEGQRTFLIAAARAGFVRGQVLLQGLFLDGRPVAMLLSFLAGRGGFAFKTAYDESLAKYSPGVQMMLDMLASLHADVRLAWMDSCAEPGHPMISRLWTDQKIIESVLVSTGGWRGDLAVSVFPMAQRLVRLARALRKGRLAHAPR